MSLHVIIINARFVHLIIVLSFSLFIFACAACISSRNQLWVFSKKKSCEGDFLAEEKRREAAIKKCICDISQHTAQLQRKRRRRKIVLKISRAPVNIKCSVVFSLAHTAEKNIWRYETRRERKRWIIKTIRSFLTFMNAEEILYLHIIAPRARLARL